MSHYDIQSEAPGSEPSRPSKTSGTTGPTAGFQNLTRASWGVLFFAVCSVVFIVANLPTGYEWRRDHWRFALPHIAVVACMAAGFRRLGDVSAVALGLPLVALSLIVTSLSNLGDNHQDGPLATGFAILQAAMLYFAAYDLRNNKNTQSRPIKFGYRMLGLALPLILLVISCSMNQRGSPPR